MDFRDEPGPGKAKASILITLGHHTQVRISHRRKVKPVGFFVTFSLFLFVSSCLFYVFNRNWLLLVALLFLSVRNRLRVLEVK